MDSVIGLGKAGCRIAERFKNYPQYSVYMISDQPRESENFFLLEKRDSHEEYELSCPDFDDFFHGVGDSCLFILAGGTKISGASLKILWHLRDKDVSILYIHPDADGLVGLTALRHNIVFGVLQQYARSGVFSQMYISQNSALESILQDIPVIGYHDKINDLLVSTIHMINIFNNTESEFDTFKEISDAARLATIGVVDIEKSQESLFFNLTMPREKCYYYAINREKLESDGTLMRSIKEQVRARLDGKTRVTYGIFSTEYESSYGYCVHYSSLIQDQQKEE